MRVIRDAYNVRSKAVHTGAVPRTYKGQDTGALLGECDRLVGEAVPPVPGPRETGLDGCSAQVRSSRYLSRGRSAKPA